MKAGNKVWFYLIGDNIPLRDKIRHDGIIVNKGDRLTIQWGANMNHYADYEALNKYSIILKRNIFNWIYLILRSYIWKR